MQKLSLYGLVLLFAIGVTGYYSCTKVNGINNNTVIETPYALYFTDTAGTLYCTNDGKTSKQVFPADGYAPRALCVANNNIIMVKSNLYLSINNGVNFNHGYDSISTYPFTACSGLLEDLNQSMIINIPSWNETFVATNANTGNNYLGVSFNLYAGGVAGYWWIDAPDSVGAIGNYGAFPITMTSFALLKNGVLCGYDGIHNRNFYRTKTTLWNECTAVADSVDYGAIGRPTNHSGIILPHVDMLYGGTDSSARYTYGEYNNRLIAIDNKNCNNVGAYYSDDTGRTWTAYQGLPNKPVLCVCSPFEQVCLVGTQQAGVYMLNTNTNTFLPSNNGLASNLTVRNIAYKTNIYKNGNNINNNFVYIATNQGIYMSIDNGNNWTLAFAGNYVNVY